MRGIEQRLRRIEDQTMPKKTYDQLIITGECTAFDEGRCPEFEPDAPIVIPRCSNCQERNQ